MTAAAPVPDYAARLARARALMEAQQVDALLVSVGSDLPYLTGYEAMASERLTMAVITASEARLVVPRLEAPRVGEGGVITTRPWAETEDPIDAVRRLVGPARRIALGAQTWSRFLLQLQAALAEAVFTDATSVMRSLRIVKDAAEIDLLRRAAASADEVVGRLRAIGFAGITEAALARRVMEMTVDAGHDTAAFAVVASGPNAASPHHEPGDRVIGEGDSVVIDFGGRLGGYCSDTTRTFHVGEPGGRFAEAYAALQVAQRQGTDAVAPGVAAEDVDRAARGVLAAAGWDEWFIHRTGHGIGRDVHEDPYLVAGNTERLEPGMTFSVEPGVYLPGEWGMRIEDIVLCTATGAESLNDSPRDLAIVG